jgi:hypothetical protein
MICLHFVVVTKLTVVEHSALPDHQFTKTVKNAPKKSFMAGGSFQNPKA